MADKPIPFTEQAKRVEQRRGTGRLAEPDTRHALRARRRIRVTDRAVDRSRHGRRTFRLFDLRPPGRRTGVRTAAGNGPTRSASRSVRRGRPSRAGRRLSPGPSRFDHPPGRTRAAFPSDAPPCARPRARIAVRHLRLPARGQVRVQRHVLSVVYLRQGRTVWRLGCAGGPAAPVDRESRDQLAHTDTRGTLGGRLAVLQAEFVRRGRAVRHGGQHAHLLATSSERPDARLDRAAVRLRRGGARPTDRRAHRLDGLAFLHRRLGRGQTTGVISGTRPTWPAGPGRCSSAP